MQVPPPLWPPSILGLISRKNAAFGTERYNEGITDTLLSMNQIISTSIYYLFIYLHLFIVLGLLQPCDKPGGRNDKMKSRSDLRISNRPPNKLVTTLSLQYLL